jgi:REP element-mobilizing transposase RayT
VFFADEDYHAYLDCLAESAHKAGCRIHAYVLMTKHVHLLVSVAQSESPGKMMKSLGQRYRWCYRANAQGERDILICAHYLYGALGAAEGKESPSFPGSLIWLIPLEIFLLFSAHVLDPRFRKSGKAVNES